MVEIVFGRTYRSYAERYHRDPKTLGKGNRGIEKVKANFEQLSQVDKRKPTSTPTPSSILEWHKGAYDNLTRLRNERCAPDETPSAKSLPVLAFYMDHSILVLNAQALRDIDAAVAIDNSASEALLNIERKSIEVACRALNSLVVDKTMIELALGFQNNQYLMICHAMTEILRVRTLSSRSHSSF